MLTIGDCLRDCTGMDSNFWLNGQSRGDRDHKRSNVVVKSSSYPKDSSDQKKGLSYSVHKGESRTRPPDPTKGFHPPEGAIRS